MAELLSTTHSPEQLRSEFAFFNELGFIRHFGVRCEILDAYRVRAIIDPVTDLHRGGIQGAAVNGGILASMFDLALGLPGLYRAHPGGRTATIQLSMSFMRPAMGNVLDTQAWIERATSGLLFTAAEARDAEGLLCATASGVVRLLAGHSSTLAMNSPDQASSK